MTDRTLHRIVCALLAFAAACVLVVALSCRARYANPHFEKAGDALGQSEAYQRTAQGTAAQVKPHADRDGKALLDVVVTALKNSLTQTGIAKGELNKAHEDYAHKSADYDRLYSSFWCRVGRWVNRIKWVLIALLGGGVLLRAVGLLVPGPWGAAASFVATGIFGALTAGVSLIQSTFDNLYFRKVAPRATAASL